MHYSSFHSSIKKILDLVFPPSEREKRMRGLSPSDLPRIQPHRKTDKKFMRAVCDYREELVREVVYALKFDGSRTAALLVGQVLREEMLAICQEERIFAEKIIITPIPLSASRRRERGFNQSARICKSITNAKEEDTFVYKQLLEKTRTTADQTELSQSQRRKNVRGVFRTTAEIDDEAVIFVIDDVTTTGATLTEARLALKEASDAKVLALAFAH